MVLRDVGAAGSVRRNICLLYDGYFLFSSCGSLNLRGTASGDHRCFHISNAVRVSIGTSHLLPDLLLPMKQLAGVLDLANREH